nr:RNA-directed DNA polymerase, eukaryota, reverse transcriptase zinc-binding domain protein [Tanacetum cinerariifolium]
KNKWAIEGDENTKFYHGVLNNKRNQLSIRGVLVDVIWIENPSLVKTKFLNHFKSRFQKPSQDRLYINMEFPRKLSSTQQADLEIDVTNEKIKKAIWDCGIDKSPGSDGALPKGSNSSFIALIPKTLGANMVKDFRPISLIGSFYKIIAKIMENRLIFILGDIVNEVKSAFVVDRQILDGPFILNELFQWSKSKKKQTMTFKVNFEKAFDLVHWDYLDDVLKKFGFGKKWYGWIQGFLRSSWGSIIVMEVPQMNLNSLRVSNREILFRLSFLLLLWKVYIFRFKEWWMQDVPYSDVSSYEDWME